MESGENHWPSLKSPFRNWVKTGLSNHSHLGSFNMKSDHDHRSIVVTLKRHKSFEGDLNENSFSIDMLFRPVQYSGISDMNRLTEISEHHHKALLHLAVSSLFILYTFLGICVLLVFLLLRRYSNDQENLTGNLQGQQQQIFNDSAIMTAPEQRPDTLVQVISTLPQCYPEYSQNTAQGNLEENLIIKCAVNERENKGNLLEHQQQLLTLDARGREEIKKDGLIKWDMMREDLESFHGDGWIP